MDRITVEDAYLRKLGLVVFNVAAIEGMLIYDLVRFRPVVPPELDFMTSTGMQITAMTTRGVGDYLVAHAAKCTNARVSTYLGTGGARLIEIAPSRNAMLHSRPGIDGTDPSQPLRLLRMVPKPDFDDPGVINDDWLDALVRRLGEIYTELERLRPPFQGTISPD
ncbi:hypothetical protein H7J93_25795 [Mycobacterium barrassiae]|uniref:hypothetical protein n=1 Tax=Mycobacterium barrassiae TaxID=319709 RepID=UPI0022659F5B|nr:hypothetical protein [Mycobacterium barrassiae]MCV7303042.1 hypothetical protein [Mycobacterium barrassiae]